MLEARRAVYLQVATFVIVIVALLLLSRFFPVVDVVAALQRRVSGLGAWSAVCYPLLFAGCNILLLPGGILSVGAGFFFGLWWGFFIVLLGNSIGAAISFGLSRWLGARWLSRHLSANRMLQVVEKAVERDASKIIFLSQFHPLFPTSLLSYLYGLTRIRFALYMFWTAVGAARCHEVDETSSTVHAEFNPNMKVFAATPSGKVQEFDLAELLSLPGRGVLEGTSRV